MPQQHHAPPTGPPGRPAEPSSPSRPAPGPGPGPDPPRTAAPADAPHPADPGSLPEPPPVARGHARGAPPPADDGAVPPKPSTQPQRDAPMVGAEGLQRLPQRTPTPAPMGEPGGGTDQPSVRSADLTNETAHGGDEALADGQPDAEPEGPAQDTGCADGRHKFPTADHAGAPPRANLATRADANTPGEALLRDPPEISAGSEAWETTPDTPKRADEGGMSPSGHNRDDDSFDAFMDSCRDDPRAVPAPEMPHVPPEPQRDQADDTPLTVLRQAHLQRDYTTLGQIATTGEGQATASGAADRTTDESNAPDEGTRVEAATNTASEPVAPPPGAAPPWGRGHLDYARLEADASHPSEQAEQEATQDLRFWIPRLATGEQLELAVRIRWVLSSRSRHLAERTRTMADVTFGHRTGHTPPATMDHPSQWRYVATRLMAHMGAYSPDEMNGLHWRWHQRAPLRIRTAMQYHNIWDIPGSPGHQGHASGHRRPRSKDVPDPSRQAARRNSPEHPWGPPPGRGSPSGTYSSPLRPFAPRRSPGSPHASRVQSDTPEQRQATRHPGRSRRRSSTPPPAARPVVFNEDMDRDHGGPPRPPRSVNIIDLRPQMPVQEAPHRADAHPHHSHAGRARAASNASSGPSPDSGRNVQLNRRLPPGVSGRSATERTTRHGHATKGARARPQPYARGGGTALPAVQKPPGLGGHIAAAGTRRERTKGGHRDDRDLQPPAARWSTAHCQALLDTPATGTPHGVRALGDNRAPPHGTPSRLTRHWTKTGWTCLPRPPDRHSNGARVPFYEAELRALYDIHASTPSSELVATLREHLRNVDPNGLFAVVPLPHAPTTQIFVRQLQALVTPGTQVSDDLIEAWIWWLNTHQPAQGGVWVPHLGWVHGLIAPPTEPQARTHHRRPGAGRPTNETRQPPYPTAGGPGGMGKRDRP